MITEKNERVSTKKAKGQKDAESEIAKKMKGGEEEKKVKNSEEDSLQSKHSCTVKSSQTFFRNRRKTTSRTQKDKTTG